MPLHNRLFFQKLSSDAGIEAGHFPVPARNSALRDSSGFSGNTFIYQRFIGHGYSFRRTV